MAMELMMPDQVHTTGTRPWLSRQRQSLLLSCALGTVLVAATPSLTQAQGFLGTPQFDPAKVDVNRSVPGKDTITLKAPTATITWTPTDNQGPGNIDFLPQGHSALFQNDPSIPNFAVLNRIIPADPTRIVSLNGSVISELQSAAGRVKGGSVAFYSPGGILIGSTAVFDVGSLLLTTLDPVRDGSGNFLDTGGNISLIGASGTQAPIITEPGSRINALSEGSYVAMVAPRIQHAGTVRVNGSAAYVAAEQANL
jgi:filamentous hemagglutinin family protein